MATKKTGIVSAMKEIGHWLSRYWQALTKKIKGKYDRQPTLVNKGSASKNKHVGACGRKGHAWRVLGDGESLLHDHKLFQCCRCQKHSYFKIKDWSDPVNWNWNRIARHYSLTIKEFALAVKSQGHVRGAIEYLNEV